MVHDIDDDDSYPGRVRGGVVGRVVFVVVLVAFVATAVFAGLAVRSRMHGKSLSDERAHVAALAGQYAVDFTSLDYRHFDADAAAAARFATPDFAKRYQAAIGVFKPAYVKKKVVQTTSVDLVGISSISKTAAVALVALKGEATNVKTKVGTAQLYRIQITLTKVGGKWLTSNVVPL